jgi:hypothetical protein
MEAQNRLARQTGGGVNSLPQRRLVAPALH